MDIFLANRLSDGNFLFPMEIRVEDDVVKIVKPGLISSREKSIKYNKLTSVEVYSPVIGFSKIIISAYNLDQLIINGFERRDAEEAVRLILKNMKGD